MIRREEARLLLAAALLSSWLIFLFTGLALGGAVHLLLAAALAVFPWRGLATARPPTDPDSAEPRP